MPPPMCRHLPRGSYSGLEAGVRCNPVTKACAKQNADDWPTRVKGVISQGPKSSGRRNARAVFVVNMKWEHQQMPSRGPPPCPKPSNAIPTRLGSWQSDLPLQPSLGFRVVKKVRSKGRFLLLTDSYRLHSEKQQLGPSRTWTALECG